MTQLPLEEDPASEAIGIGRGIEVSVRRPGDLTDLDLELWRSWQRADERLSSPFLSPEFAVVFGRHNSAARVAVLQNAGETVGFLPFQRHGTKVGRSLAYDLSDVQALISPDDLEWDAPAMMTACGMAVFEFDHWVPHQSRQLRARHLKLAPAPVIDLTNGYEGWLAQAKHSQGRIKKVLQKHRKLERELGKLSFEFDSHSHDDLEQLMRWKGEQYVRTGRGNRFANKWFCDFVTDLFDTRTDTFSLRLSRLDAGDETVALYLSLQANNVLTGWFPTYNPSPEVAPYSPGMASMVSLIRAAGDEGYSRLELGEGEADYKESFKTHDDHVAEGWVERKVLAAVMRRAQKAPGRTAIRIILGNPRLRSTVRSTLNHVGRARSALGR